MKSIRNLTGMVFGHLTVLEQVGFSASRNRNTLWSCKCDCGKVIVVRGDNLTTGHSTKCKECSIVGRRVKKYVDRQF